MVAPFRKKGYAKLGLNGTTGGRGSPAGQQGGGAKSSNSISSSDSSFTIGDSDSDSDSDGDTGGANDGAFVGLEQALGADTAAKGGPMGYINTVFDTLTFSFMKPLLKLGNINDQLEPGDLIELMADDRTDTVRDTFKLHWSRSKMQANQAPRKPVGLMRLVPSFLVPKVQHPSLTSSLWSSFSGPFLRAGLLKLVHDLNVFVGPQVRSSADATPVMSWRLGRKLNRHSE